MEQRADSPRLWTIPPGAPFLDSLARALIDGALVPGNGATDFSLADTTILLPTRRACRGFGEALVAARGGQRTREAQELGMGPPRARDAVQNDPTGRTLVQTPWAHQRAWDRAAVPIKPDLLGLQVRRRPLPRACVPQGGQGGEGHGPR